MQRWVHCLIRGSLSVQAARSGIQPTTFWSRTHPPHFHQFSVPALEMGRHSASPNNIKDCYKYQQPLTCMKAILILKVMLFDSYCDEISIFHYLHSIYLHYSFDYFQILVVILMALCRWTERIRGVKRRWKGTKPEGEGGKQLEVEKVSQPVVLL